jgi:hypothetical protein
LAATALAHHRDPAVARLAEAVEQIAVELRSLDLHVERDR